MNLEIVLKNMHKLFEKREIPFSEFGNTLYVVNKSWYLVELKEKVLIKKDDFGYDLNKYLSTPNNYWDSFEIIVFTEDIYNGSYALMEQNNGVKCLYVVSINHQAKTISYKTIPLCRSRLTKKFIKAICKQYPDYKINKKA